MTSPLDHAMRLAIDEAKKYEGATSPNPIVGACAMDDKGNILGVDAHKKFGGPHAEVELLKQVIDLPVHTVVVTLEPCCYHGKTPPCTRLLIERGVKRVVVGAEDPNPKVSSKGIKELKNAGIEVIFSSQKEQCEKLIAPFKKFILTEKPWVIIKRAFNPEGSMIPRDGQKTFTSRDALTYAHKLRRSCDAIITGNQTILADDPHFTVRHVEDHPNKSRFLVVMDRRNVVPESYTEEAARRGFSCIRGEDIEKVLQLLGSKGVMRVLVEAGPTLSDSFIDGGFVDEEVNIVQTERITHVYRNY